jgi:2'-hydroxyisoflavone reductase
MQTRRHFITQSGAVAAAGGIIASGGTQLLLAATNTSIASEHLRILILGGTGHIGPYHVRAALERGHHVAVFSRGKTSSELPLGVERLIGDRNGDLESIKNRDWDAVFDLATFVPVWVRTLGQALQGRVRHYTFISTEAVYDTPSNNTQGTDEESKVLQYKDKVDPYSITYGPYGELKVLCEREAQKQFPGKTLVLRPGNIVGPGDSIGGFTYWPMRLEMGGEVLAAGDPLSHVQWIDVRDMAEWAIRLAEQRETGVFNTIGPASPMNWATMLDTLRAPSVPVTFTWVPIPWLMERKITAWSNLLFWPTEAGRPGLMNSINDRAQAKGLTFRPLRVTARDAVAWFRAQPPEIQKQALLGENGPGILENSISRERQLLDEWHAQQKKPT